MKLFFDGGLAPGSATVQPQDAWDWWGRIGRSAPIHLPPREWSRKRAEMFNPPTGEQSHLRQVLDHRIRMATRISAPSLLVFPAKCGVARRRRIRQFGGQRSV